MIWSKVLQSLAITCTVSIVFSLFLLNFNFNFLYSFLFFTLLQFVGFYFYGEFIKFKNSQLLAEAEIKAIEEISKVTADVICPCDRGIVASLPLSLHKKNEYICEGCNKRISVILEPKTALITEPMNTTSLDEPQFIEGIKKLVEESKI